MNLAVPEKKQPSPTAALTCDHCGDPCGIDTVTTEEHHFCCHGCHLVFDLLHQNELGEYYQLEQRPGISQSVRHQVDYSFLDDDSIQEQLVDFANTKQVRLRLHLPQIHCVSCVWLLEHLYKLMPGVLESRVNFMQRTASVVFDPQLVSLKEVVETLARIGYPPELQLHQLEAQQQLPKHRALYYRLGVAGFAFGNIMLLSFPEYLGLEASGYATVFGYLNLLLALPVLLYCAYDYWQSAYWGVRQKHLNIDVPITIGMLALFGRSAFEILTHSEAGYLDSLAGLVFFLLIGKWFQQRTYSHLSFERDYKSYFPIAVTRKMANEDQQATPLQKLAIGDTIIVKNQELIPADGYLLKGDARIDYSFVTGESEAIRVAQGEKIFAGGRQLGSMIEVTVAKAVSQSYLTQLWNDSAFDKAETSSTHLADQIGRIFTIAILLIAAATLLYWLPQDVGKAINAFTAVLIVACPCAVALSIPFTYGNMLRWLSRQDFFLKNINVIDRLHRIDAVVFDKTGTLTDTQKQKLDYHGQPLTDQQKIGIKSLAVASSHPLSRSLAQHLSTVDSLPITDYHETPGAGTSAWVSGLYIKLGSAAFVNGPTSIKGTKVGIAINGQFYGCFRVEQRLRSGVENLLERWTKDYDLFLLSGDKAREVERFSRLFGGEHHLHFGQLPKDKLAFIKQLQNQGKHVLMIGDGLNDAGALQQSDVGLVVTENVNNFSPACDGILTAKQLPRLQRLLRYIQQGRWIVIAAYALAAIYNLIGLSYAVTATLSPVVAAILMPLSSITIVVFGTGLSSWLGWRMNR